MPINKEIEFSLRVDDTEPYLEYLKRIGARKIHDIEIERDIYKNGSGYFIKVSKEKIDGKNNYMYCLKEDLIDKGQSGVGLKVSEEIDVPVSSDQLEKLSAMLELLKFKKTSSFKKSRQAFTKDDFEIDVDTYYFEDKTEYYIEVEGKEKDKINLFVKNMQDDLSLF